MATRAEIVDLVWDGMKSFVYLTKEQYTASLAMWNVEPHYNKEGDLVGATLVKDEHFHFATFGRKWRLTMKDVRHYLLPIIEKYGCVKTSTAIEDERQREFNERIGFVKCSTDEFWVHYRLDQLPPRKSDSHAPD